MVGTFPCVSCFRRILRDTSLLSSPSSYLSSFITELRFVNIRINLVVGIGGGIPTTHIRLGDVVVCFVENYSAVFKYAFDYDTVLGIWRVHRDPPSLLIQRAVQNLRAQYMRKDNQIDEAINAVGLEVKIVPKCIMA